MCGEIRISLPSGDAEWLWLKTLWRSEWGGETMVSRGHVFRLDELNALVARCGGELVGAATYRFDDDHGCELMSINATMQGEGIGTKLLAAVEEAALSAGCHRVWLITSNDNLGALRFYQRRGYRLTAVYHGAIDQARRIKPNIPLVGDFGIEIHDEIELSKDLHVQSQTKDTPVR
jgi:GNAT superfamily N-acetyltransferase